MRLLASTHRVLGDVHLFIRKDINLLILLLVILLICHQVGLTDTLVAFLGFRE